MANLNIAVEILGKDNASPAVNSFQKSLDKMGDTAKGIGTGFTNFAVNAASLGASLVGGPLMAGLTQLPGMMVEFAKGAGEDAAASARLSQTLQNLGGDFGQHMGAVLGAIDAGQKLAFSDDEVRDSFQSLATATGSVEEGLSRQALAMDLARGAGIPLEAASRLLGKVNEENVEVFKRMGITLGENATEADALRVVQEKFGGQAERFAQTVPGMFEQVNLAMGEIQESLGNIILPLFATVATTLADNLPAIQEWIGILAEGLSEQIANAIIFVEPLFQEFWKTIEAFGKVVEKVIDGDVVGAFTDFLSFVTKLRADLIKQFLEWGKALIDWIAPRIPELISKALELWNTLKDWVIEKQKELVTTLLTWGQAFIDWIVPKIPELMAELGKLATQLVAWIDEQTTKLLAETKKWGESLVNWVVEAAPPMMAKLEETSDGITNWVSTNGTEFLNKLSDEWIPAFITWLDELGPQLTAKLDQLATDIIAWIDSIGTQGEGEIDTQWLVKFGEAAGRVTLALLNIFKKLLVDLPLVLIDLGIKLVLKIADITPDIVAAMDRAGKRMVEGIWAGIQSLLPWLGTQVANAMSGMVEAAKTRLKMFSPSVVAQDEIGKPFIWGIGAGMVAAMPWLQQQTVAVIDTGMRDAGTEASYKAWRAVMGEASRAIEDSLPDVIDAGTKLSHEAWLSIGDSAAKNAEEAAKKAVDAYIKEVDKGTALSEEAWRRVMGPAPSAPSPGQGAGGGDTGGGSGGGGGIQDPGGDGQPISGRSYLNDPLYQLISRNAGWHSQVPGKGPLAFDGVTYDPLFDTERGHGTSGTNKDKSGHYRVLYRMNTLLNVGQATSVLDAARRAIQWVRDNTPDQYWGGLGWKLDGRQWGGLVGPNRAYVVGERGPETLLMGPSSGRVLPGGGGTPIINVTVNVPRWIGDVDEAAGEIWQALLKIQRLNGRLGFMAG